MKARSSSTEEILAPEEPRHVAWGASPRKANPNHTQSPEGATAVRAMESCRRPSGVHGVHWAGIPWGLRPRLHAFAPLGQSREEILEFREATP